jgi:hypothetical protein
MNHAIQDRSLPLCFDRVAWTLAVALLLTVTSKSAVAAGPVVDPETVGTPNAQGKLVLLEDEIVDGLKRRNIQSQFSRFQAYAARKLDTTSGPRTGSEVTSICRLKWYDHLMRNALKAPAEAEQFTRELHAALMGNHEGLDRALIIAREKMDQAPREPGVFPEITSPERALEAVKRALTDAQVGYAAALSTLTQSEISQLVKTSYSVFTSGAKNGHTLPQRGAARRQCKLLMKLDQESMYAAADAMVPLADPELLRQLGLLGPEQGIKLNETDGTAAVVIATASGKIVIGGRGNNRYQLDQLDDVNVVIDLGGDDEYFEGTVNLKRPVLIVIDLAGNDTYRASKPGVQGAAVMGISMLLDVAGNDTYQAKDLAQGSCLGGVGILVDYAGDDSYRALRRAQGQALGGIGILLDRDGNDSYHAAMWAQGFGHPLGFGVLDDLDGADHYYCGGLYADSYEEHPGYEGWGQGVGAGLRQVANGGIGSCLDGGGDDVYEFDYIAHGGGYWLGVGFARDFGGNDKRLGVTLKAYNGGARRQGKWQRFSNGFGCHYTLGFSFDDQGNDTYGGTIMGVGFAWDCSVGFLCDFSGNDHYQAKGNGTQGNGAQAGLGVIYDYDGDDVYSGYGQGNASAKIDYHDMPGCGGNFSFVIDYGGKDSYGCRAKNSSYIRRGTSGGFLIDRPRSAPADDGDQEDEESVATKVSHSR